MAKWLESWTVLPHGPLEEIDDGLLTVAGEIRMPLGNFPRRMTVIRLAGDRTAIWSAIALEEPLMQRIESLGAPAVLIVPNDHHRMDLKIWKARYPQAKVLAPPAAKAAVEEAAPVDATSDILADPDVAYENVPGLLDRESAVTVRRRAGTSLIVNDIIGHVRHPHGIGAQIMGRLFGFGVGGAQIPWPAKLLLVRDKAALAARFRAWAADPALRRIIVSHGDPITDDPAGTLRRLADGLAP